MQLKDIVRCPNCGGAEIIYSCEPKCCFNHVCADCRTSFQLVTTKTGGFDLQAATNAQEPPSGDPTAGCAACDSLRLAVFSNEDGTILLVCGNCGARLKLTVEEIEVGT